MSTLPTRDRKGWDKAKRMWASTTVGKGLDSSRGSRGSRGVAIGSRYESLIPLERIFDSSRELSSGMQRRSEPTQHKWGTAKAIAGRCLIQCRKIAKLQWSCV